MLATWQVGQLLWSMMWFFFFFVLIWLVISVFMDIFRSPDLGGWGKALWTLFVIVFPWLGVFVYLLARGSGMAERRMDRANGRYAAGGDWGYSAPVAYGMPPDYAPVAGYGPPSVASPASDLTALAELHDRGVIDDAEFRSMKQRVVAS
jgi:hypothetical protein